MIHPLSFVILALASSIILLTPACHRSAPPEAVPLAEVAPQMESAFKEAAGEIKTLAQEAVASIQNSQSPEAFLKLQDLCAKPELTGEQRALASKALLTVNEQIRAAAAKGDARAIQILQLHQSRK